MKDEVKQVQRISSRHRLTSHHYISTAELLFFYVSLLINEMPLLWRSSSNRTHHPANWKYKAIKKLAGSRIGGKCHNKQIPPPGIDLQPILIYLDEHARLINSTNLQIVRRQCCLNLFVMFSTFGSQRSTGRFLIKCTCFKLSSFSSRQSTFLL